MKPSMDTQRTQFPPAPQRPSHQHYRNKQRHQDVSRGTKPKDLPLLRMQLCPLPILYLEPVRL